MDNDQSASLLMSGNFPTGLGAVVAALEAAVVLGEAAKAILATVDRAVLEQELRTIDAKWRPQVSEEAKLALGKELKAIDAKWRSQVSEEAKLALGKELKAIDTKWRPEVLNKELRAIDAK
ncbi:MAG: hypothetical protein AB8U31_03710, partial [Anaplasma ovis]